MGTALRSWLVPLAVAVAVGLGGAARAADPPREGHEGSPDEKVYHLLRDVINQGVELYDARDYAGCYHLWEGSLKTLRPFCEHRKEWQKAIDDAFADAQNQPLMWQRDWALRRAMDRIRDDIHPPKRAEMRTSPPPGTRPGAGTGTGGGARSPGGTRTATLWDRLGGEPGVGRVIDEIVAVAGKDPKVDFARGGRFQPTPGDLAKFRQEMIAWVSSKTGGPLPYTGESMKQAHKGMGITDPQFDAFVADVRGVLAKHNLRPDDEKAVLDALEATRPDIVEKKSGEEPKAKEKKPEEKKPEADAGAGSVTGKVTYKGKPLPGGTVTLTGKDGKAVSGAIVEDGSYTVRAVKPGTYTMTVDTSAAKGKAFVAIPEKYKEADKSGLTVEVKEGNQNHDIDLID